MCHTQLIVTPVADSDSSLPNFGGCTTSGMSVDVPGVYIEDIYCANPRTEDNPLTAALRYDEESNAFSCYCFMTAFEDRSGVVECGLFVKRCKDIVHV